MARPNPFDLLDTPDQTQIEAELRTFFGRHPEPFLSTYRKMLAKRRGGKKSAYASTFNWAVFFLSFVWFFYRKLYVSAAVILVGIFLVGHFTPDSTPDIGLGIAVTLAMTSNYSYVQQGLIRIGKADRQGLTGQARLDYITRSGGVSLVAGIVSGSFLILILVAGIASVILFGPDSESQF